MGMKVWFWFTSTFIPSFLVHRAMGAGRWWVFCLVGVLAGALSGQSGY